MTVSLVQQFLCSDVNINSQFIRAAPKLPEISSSLNLPQISKRRSNHDTSVATMLSFFSTVGREPEDRVRSRRSVARLKNVTHGTLTYSNSIALSVQRVIVVISRNGGSIPIKSVLRRPAATNFPSVTLFAAKSESAAFLI